MFEDPPIYKTYILRFWEERDAAQNGQPSVWRFSLVDPETETRYGFRSLEEMTQFIEKQQGN